MQLQKNMIKEDSNCIQKLFCRSPGYCADWQAWRVQARTFLAFSVRSDVRNGKQNS